MAVYVIVVEETPKSDVGVKDGIEGELFVNVVHLRHIILGLVVEATRVNF